MVQKTPALHSLILPAIFLVSLTGSAGAHAGLHGESCIFNNDGYASALEEKELRLLANPQNYGRSASWLGKARNPEDIYMQFDFGVMHELGRNYERAAAWYRLAAEQGLPDAQNNLGWLYENGKGVQQDYSEAIYWYREAATQGNADAQFNMGVAYYNGRGVARNLMQAHMWFSLAEKRIGLEASNSRKSVEAEMTPEQIEKAQQLAHDWSKKNHR